MRGAAWRLGAGSQLWKLQPQPGQLKPTDDPVGRQPIKLLQPKRSLVNAISSSDTVTLELTGPLERLVGEGVVQLPVSQRQLGEVLAALVEQCPETQEHLGSAAELRHCDGPLPPGFLVIRDGTTVPARLETPIDPGERLTLLSIISGG